MNSGHLRKTKRPLIGIFHAAFAQACILSFFLKIVSGKEFPTYSDEAMMGINKYKNTFLCDFICIQENEILDFDEEIGRFLVSIKDFVKNKPILEIDNINEKR